MLVRARTGVQRVQIHIERDRVREHKRVICNKVKAIIPYVYDYE